MFCICTCRCICVRISFFQQPRSQSQIAFEDLQKLEKFLEATYLEPSERQDDVAFNSKPKLLRWTHPKLGAPDTVAHTQEVGLVYVRRQSRYHVYVLKAPNQSRCYLLIYLGQLVGRQKRQVTWRLPDRPQFSSGAIGRCLWNALGSIGHGQNSLQGIIWGLHRVLVKGRLGCMRSFDHGEYRPDD